MTTDYDPTNQWQRTPNTEIFDSTSFTTDDSDEALDNVLTISNEALQLMRERVKESMGHIATPDALANARMDRETPDTEVL